MVSVFVTNRGAFCCLPCWSAGHSKYIEMQKSRMRHDQESGILAAT